MYELKFDADHFKAVTEQSKVVITQNGNEYLRIDSKTNYVSEFLCKSDFAISLTGDIIDKRSLFYSFL